MNKIILTLIFAMAAAGTCNAQNFGLINQNPQTSKDTETSAGTESAATEAQDASAAAPTTSAPNIQNVTSSPDIKAYEAARPYIATDMQNSHYTLGPNDVLTIAVQRHPEVSGKYPINMEGKIQFEFVGDIVLSGMAKEQATQIIAKRLQKYIINPDVTVTISEYNSKVVYVVGEVGAPGKIYMRSDTMTVRDALLAANLPQLTASTDNATLFTPSASGKVVPKKVNVYALLYEGDLRQNYIMKPGDTLYLPATLWAKVARFLNPITQPIGQAASTGGAIKYGL